LSPDARRQNLPADLTSFVGRDRELSELKALLGTTRLLSLTGPGGVGKTRLGTRLLSDVVSDVPGGVWVIDLAPLTSFDQITEAPLNGYNTLDTITTAINQVFVARSSLVCTSVGVPVYAKLRILSFNDVDREITFEVLANRNCGFRELTPGIPQN